MSESCQLHHRVNLDPKRERMIEGLNARRAARGEALRLPRRCGNGQLSARTVVHHVDLPGADLIAAPLQPDLAVRPVALLGLAKVLLFSQEPLSMLNPLVGGEEAACHNVLTGEPERPQAAAAQLLLL